MAERIRWIGFDMDECIGSVMPLYVFLNNLPEYVRKNNSQDKYDEILYRFANQLYHSEQNRKTYVLRPAILDVLEMLYNAHRLKQIQGAFLYSNNSSMELVTFMAFFLNVCIWNMFDTEGKRPIVFKMASWNGMPARKEYGLIKNYEAIQACLSSLDLPKCSSKQDLLFFDDISHPLEKEIPNYTRVPPYYHHTDIESIQETFHPLNVYFTKNQWSTMVTESKKNRAYDFLRPTNQYLSNHQSARDESRDKRIFRKAIANFLYTKPARGYSSRKQRATRKKS